MQNRVIKNFLNQQEIDYIKNIINIEKNKRTMEESYGGRHHQTISEDKMYIKKNLSRLNIYDIKINDINILNKIKNNLPKNFNYKSMIINYCEYNKKFGNIDPNLKNHVDTGEFSFIIAYQLSSNIDWTFYIKNNNFILKDNDAIIFYPLIELHGRKERIFEKNEYLEMLFFEFKSKGEIDE